MFAGKKNVRVSVFGVDTSVLYIHQVSYFILSLMTFSNTVHSDYVGLLSANGQVKNIRRADWTEVTIPSWRHSIMVGVFNPWPVIKRYTGLILQTSSEEKCIVPLKFKCFATAGHGCGGSVLEMV